MELNSTAAFDPRRDTDFFASLPEAAALVRIEPRGELAGARPYLIRTSNLRRRLERLLGPAEPGPVGASAQSNSALSTAGGAKRARLSLRDFASGIRYRVAGSAFELAFLHWQQARALDPRGYRSRLRLRSPALIKMNLANPYPRCYVTRRLLQRPLAAPSTGSFCYGPFPSRRAAENFCSEFLNLFKIRRCQIKIQRDPSFPGCLYSEMKMCLAPCFAGCSDEQYAREAARVRDFLTTSGASLLRELEGEREHASAALDFERASEWHRRLDQVKEVLRPLPALVRRIDQLDAVILQCAAEPQAVAIFLVRGGTIAEPFLLHFGPRAEPHSPTAAYSLGVAGRGDQPISAEEMLREKFSCWPAASSAGAEPASSREAGEVLADHLALLARWFYSKPRAGEIFFREEDWPYRRLIRACGRLLAA
jgi:excinuclease ABC subunit C